MKKVLLADYLAYITLKALGPFFRILPRRFGLLLGRILGELVYLLDLRHRALAYANIRQAMGDKVAPCRLIKIVRRFYRHLGESIVEIFLIPAINEAYLKKYFIFEGMAHIEEVRKQGKGIIFVSVHAGSWELSSIICANLGIPFSLLVRDQRYPRLERLLNSLRSEKGCRFIQRENQLRRIIEILKSNEAIGMTVDQGGRAGVLVDFFGRESAMASGAVRLALKYGCPIIPVFYTRAGLYLKTLIAPAFVVKQEGDLEKDIQDNLQGLVRIFEKFILQYPQEYLWTYKIWKYGRLRRILLLSDAKAGHLRQSQAVARLVENIYAKRGMRVSQETLEVGFKNRLRRLAFTALSLLAGKYNCQGCLACLEKFLEPGAYQSLLAARPDVIISCGAKLSAVNFLLSRENNAKGICVLRPGLLSTGRFDAVFIPRHDKPPRRNNIFQSDGALNIIDEQYLKAEGEKLLQAAGSRGLQANNSYIGLLLGGDTKNFSLSPRQVKVVIAQLKDAAEKLGTFILATSSRRTPPEIERLLEDELGSYQRCRLLIIAGKDNPPYAIGGILYLSKLVIVSPESISMVSEAAASGRQVLVFQSPLDRRHRAFLNSLSAQGYISLVEEKGIASLARQLWLRPSGGRVLDERVRIEEFLEKRL
jgi:KDO2-lipid IV(A) lauroyltransferase